MINNANQYPRFSRLSCPLSLQILRSVTLIDNLLLTIETNPRDSVNEDAYYYHTVMNQRIDL